MFKIKTRYYLELLTAETMKLLGSTKSKIPKDKNGVNIPYLEIIEIVLIHGNVVNISYQQNSRILHTFMTLMTRYNDALFSSTKSSSYRCI